MRSILLIGHRIRIHLVDPAPWRAPIYTLSRRAAVFGPVATGDVWNLDAAYNSVWAAGNSGAKGDQYHSTESNWPPHVVVRFI